MTSPAPIGHNEPPSDIDDALAPYADAIDEAQTWLDGHPVETEAAMKGADDLAKQIKAALKAVHAAEESASRPLYDQWKAAKARYKPTLDDLERLKRGLAALVTDYKRRLAAEREAERRKAEAEARRKREAAEAAARAARADDIESARAADDALASAVEAQKAARAIETVKGLRTVARHEVTDHRALLHWIAANDRDAITAFIEDYARRHHRDLPESTPGLRVWREKVAT